MKHIHNRKGGMLETGKAFIVTLLIIGVLLSVTGILTSSLANSIPGTGGSSDGMKNMTANGSLVTFQTNFGAQLPTVGVIAGVALIVVVVVGGILVLFKKKGGI
jgi:hypothetical protein